jgi:imidazolonepropionase-like amidohydrolase
MSGEPYLCFKAAVDRGVVEGPRLLVSDKPLSQTGGHGDWRRRSETQPPEIFCPTAGMRSVVCDGRRGEAGGEGATEARG